MQEEKNRIDYNGYTLEQQINDVKMRKHIIYLVKKYGRLLTSLELEEIKNKFNLSKNKEITEKISDDLIHKKQFIDDGNRIINLEKVIEEDIIIYKDEKFKTDMTMSDFIHKLDKKSHCSTVSGITNRWKLKQMNEHIRYLKKKFNRELTKEELKLIKKGKL